MGNAFLAIGLPIIIVLIFISILLFSKPWESSAMLDLLREADGDAVTVDSDASHKGTIRDSSSEDEDDHV